MAKHLYEGYSLSRNPDSDYLPQHRQTAMSLAHGTSDMISVQHSVSSPMSPLLNREPFVSPVSSGTNLSSMMEATKTRGIWGRDQLEKTIPDHWESLQEVYADPSSRSNESNMELSTKLHFSVPQRLDSLCTAFPTPNFPLVYDNSNGQDTRPIDNNHSSEAFLSPQALPFSGIPNLQPFAYQPQLLNVTMHSPAQYVGPQRRYQPVDTQHAMHTFHHSHQQSHYEFQQQHQQETLSPAEQRQHGFHEQQSQHCLHQQGFQDHQNQDMLDTLVVHQQQHLHLQQQKESYFLPMHQELKDMLPFYPGPNHDVAEQQSFSAGAGLSVKSPHDQEQQEVLHETPQSNQQTQQQIHSKQHEEAPFDCLSCFDRDISPIMPGFSSPLKGSYTSLNSRDTVDNPYFQNMAHASTQQTTDIGEISYTRTLHCVPWPQMHKEDIQDNINLPLNRKSAVEMQKAIAKLRCSVCQREFKSLPALNGHMRSHGGFRTHPSVSKKVKHDPASSKIHLSSQNLKIECDLDDGAEMSLLPPSHPKDHTSITIEGGAPQHARKRHRVCLEPLVIPPPKAGLACRGAVRFMSLLRSPGSLGEDTPYTPPPMLDPLRSGPGLFTLINAEFQYAKMSSVQRVLLDAVNSVNDQVIASGPGERPVKIKPQINIGARFQAIIPEMEIPLKAEKDTHKASLVWTPCADMETHDNNQRVDDLLKMACSSVLPGGGANIELVLHCLFECSWDIMATLERLLLFDSLRTKSSPLLNYHYAGSDKWTLQEKRQLNKALVIHHKDFHLIQKMMRTKTVAQCVEYYYTWKKRLHLGRRLSTGLITPNPEREGEWDVNTGQLAHEGKKPSRDPVLSEVPYYSNRPSACNDLMLGPVSALQGAEGFTDIGQQLKPRNVLH